MQTIAERLEEARADAGMSIRALQKRLHEDQIEGASYANVHAIFAGNTQPRIEFVEHAARMLGVSPAWLAFGTLPKSPAAKLARDTLRQAIRDRTDATLRQREDEFSKAQAAILGAFEAGFPAARDARLTGTAWPPASGPWFYARARLGDEPAAAKAIGKALAAPLAALDIDPRHISPWQFEQYAKLVSAALETVLVTSRTVDYRRKVLGSGKRGRAKKEG